MEYMAGGSVLDLVSFNEYLELLLLLKELRTCFLCNIF